MKHEKIELPKFMCKWVDELTATGTGLMVSTDCYPLMAVADTYKLRGEANHAIRDWLDKADNQWKLIDALRYGYVPEPEQLYYVRFIEGYKNAFLNFNTETKRKGITDRRMIDEFKTKFTMPEIIAIDPRYKAFAVPVEDGGQDD